MNRLGSIVAAVGLLAAQPAPPLPPIDLATVLLQQVPPGFTQLPDQAGRFGPLDAGAAAAVLDQSGRVKGEMLTRSGFVAGHSRVWSKQDSQEVIVDVLLAFGTDRQARTFARGFVSGRRQTTKPFDIPGTPEAFGFERGPATPTREAPGQREVIVQRGRVLAIVVLAGFASYPNVDLARTLADAQRATLASVQPTEDPEQDGTDEERTGMTGIAVLLLIAVAGWMVALMHHHPVVGGARLLRPGAPPPSPTG